MHPITEVALKYIDFPAVKYDSPNYGNTPAGFDCSGFIQHILTEAKIQIPKSPITCEKIRHTEEFFDWFGIFIHDEAKSEGDLVFFSRNGLRPTHIGIFINDNQIIHSPGLNGEKVRINTLEELCKRPILYNAKKGPIIYLKNPIGYKRITAYLNGKRFQKFLI